MRRKLVVFVCTANRCRSLLAEYCLRSFLAETRYAEVLEVASAGMMTEAYWRFFEGFLKDHGKTMRREDFYGVPPYASTLACMRRRGWEAANYLSQPFSAALAAKAALVVVMERVQGTEVVARYPDLTGRVLTLRELAGETEPLLLEESYYRPRFDASDPHYVSYEEDYVERSFQEIKACLLRGLTKLLAIVD